MSLLTEPRTRLQAGAHSKALAYVPLTAAVVDAGVLLMAIGVGVTTRSHLWIFDSSTDISSSLKVAGPLILITWLLVIYLLGGYRSDVFGAGPDEFKRVVNAALLTAGLVGVASYLAKFPLSRGFFLVLFVLAPPLLVTGRLVLRRVLQQARMAGTLQQRVIIAGGPSYVDEIAAVLHRESWLGYHVVGALTPAHSTDPQTRSGIRVVGNIDDVASTVTDTEVDVIFFAGGAHTSAAEMRRMVWELEQHDVQIVVAPSVSDISSERIRVRPVGGLPLMHLDPPTWSDASRIGKRTFDILGSLVLLIAFSPVFILAALRIRLHDRGPVVFRQTRVGRRGHHFACLKFRTMVTDAEAMLARLHAEQGYSEGLFKMKDDPRITRPGRWLRRYSIDELPQLVNVLRGEMSLVGPRPPLPLEVQQYVGDTARRLHVRPGLTGLWQVSGRSDLSWDEAIRLDLYYVDNWSMLQDLNILTKTLGAVFASRGAY